jgi:galactose-1-phosphate uridylyltransferase
VEYLRYYSLMADGTIKQINPFTDNEVWSVPGRGAKPSSNDLHSSARELTASDHLEYCSFCENRMLETPPEKSRIYRDSAGMFEKAEHVLPEHYHDTDWLFRRVPNLFEIVTVDYWKKNYEYSLSKRNLQWKDSYLESPAGKKHVIDVLDYKLRAIGNPEVAIAALPETDKILLSDAFFGGGHEVVIAKPHFAPGAVLDNQLFSSGEMSPEEHYQYFRFTIGAMQDIFASNRYIRYISIFQNWLAPAGASFDHLHKQLVGLDDWGSSIRHQVDMLRIDSNVYNEFGANLAAMHNLVFAENDWAIAFAGIGHRHPTLEIFSKARAARPFEHSAEELRGVSDLVHACHAAMGSRISCNEEWYYTPIDAVHNMPWHVLIKWRVNTSAGFEGGTSIFINPIAPLKLRDRMVPKLYQLREEHRISHGIRIAEECTILPNPLKYYLG